MVVLLAGGLILLGSLGYALKLVQKISGFSHVRRRWQEAEQSQAMYFATCRLLPSVTDRAELQERILQMTNGSPEQATAAIASAMARRARVVDP